MEDKMEALAKVRDDELDALDREVYPELRAAILDPGPNPAALEPTLDGTPHSEWWDVPPIAVASWPKVKALGKRYVAGKDQIEQRFVDAVDELNKTKM